MMSEESESTAQSTLSTTSASNTPGTLVTIPDCAAYHLVGSEEIPLAASSPLSLVSTRGSTATPVLTLTLGTSLAFPLGPGTLLGTQTGNGRVYLMKPALEGLESMAQGWVKLELPAGVEDDGTELGKLRDTWEDVLIDHGFLLDGAMAGGADEVRQGIVGGSIAGGAALESLSSRYESTTTPPDAPPSFSSTTHSNVQRAADSTASARSYTQFAAEKVAHAAAQGGAYVAHAVGLDGEPTREQDKSEARKTAEEVGGAAAAVGSGIAEGASNLSSSAGTASHRAIAHTDGEESAQVVGKAGQAAYNVGGTLVDATLATSVVKQAGEVEIGAARGAGEDE